MIIKDKLYSEIIVKVNNNNLELEMFNAKHTGFSSIETKDSFVEFMDFIDSDNYIYSICLSDINYIMYKV